MLPTDDTGVEHTGLGIEGVDGGVDTKLSNRTRQHSRGIQVGEGGSGSRIRQIIGGHVDGLHGSDGTLLGGGDTLLPISQNTRQILMPASLINSCYAHATHVRRERGLVTDGRRDTTEQGRHLRTSLGETEDVVDEKKHVLALLITEVLRNGKTSERNTGTGTRGLVHLTEDEGDLGVTLEVDDTGLNHLVVQVVTLTGTLTDTCDATSEARNGAYSARQLAAEDGETTVRLGDVVDELLDEHSLTDTSTTEETNLSTTGVGGYMCLKRM